MFTKIIAFLTALIMIFSPYAMSVIGATEGEPIIAAEREHVYDADRLLTGVYCFPKDGRFDTLLGYLDDAGIDFFIGSWGQNLTEDDFARLQELGMGIFAPNSEYYRTVDSDAVWGIDLRDEPNAADFDDLAAAVAAQYEQNPKRLPVVNLFPMYASDDQLGEYPAIEPPGNPGVPFDSFNSSAVSYRMHVSDYINRFDSDVISVDIYPLNMAHDDARTLSTWDKWLRNLDILAEACRKTNRDLWVITQAAGNYVDDNGGQRYCDTVGDQRWQNYVSLAFGAKAIIYACFYTGWWDADSHMIDSAGERTDTYYAVKDANAELAAFADVYGEYENTGTFIVNRLNKDAAGCLLPLTKCEAKKPSVRTSAPVLVGCFDKTEGDGNAYVITNMYEPQTGKTAQVTVEFSGASSLTVYRKGGVSTVSGSKLDLTLENEEGVFVEVNG
ncbi:MAG: hypothetical protein K6C36_00950 [Clostridia bacterium]|nr:hypothetical protein [Clostridia bacterium]